MFKEVDMRIQRASKSLGEENFQNRTVENADTNSWRYQLFFDMHPSNHDPNCHWIHEEYVRQDVLRVYVDNRNSRD